MMGCPLDSSALPVEKTIRGENTGVSLHPAGALICSTLAAQSATGTTCVICFVVVVPALH